MKSFFKCTLAVILGCLIFSILGFFIMMGIASGIMSSAEKQVVIEENSVLKLNLGNEVVDRGTKDPFQSLEALGLSGMKKTGLDDLLSALEKAKTEDKIKGILLRVDDVPAGYASLKEIRDALLDFKKESGKFIYAYSEMYSQEGYYLASVADKIYLTPEGSLDIHGLASQSLYYKNLFDKLGIEIQVIRHGKFKSAVEPFILDEMSDANREQISTYINSIWGTFAAEISESRSLSIDSLNDLADAGLSFRTPNFMLENGLVDVIAYEDQFLDFLRSELGIAPNKKIPFASVDDMSSVVKQRTGKGLAKNKIAVIYASGEIVMESTNSMSSESEIAGKDLAREIRTARLDSSIKAIVLRVNSPGGSALASELIWRETLLAKQAKPFVVSMGDMAASGGYYISCAADTILAQPTTITGSIGVFGMIPNAEKLLEKKLGISSQVVKTNELSDFPSTFREMTVNERTITQEMVENVYSTFVNHVSDGRKMSFEAVDSIGQGRVWSGENAIKLGLVDKLGNLDDAIEIAKNMADLDTYRIVKLPKQKDPFEELFSSAVSTVKIKILEEELGTSLKYYRLVEKIKGSEGVMARMPYGFELN